MNITVKKLLGRIALWVFFSACLIWHRTVFLESKISSVILGLMALNAVYEMVRRFHLLTLDKESISIACRSCIGILYLSLTSYVLLYGFYAIRELLATV